MSGNTYSLESWPRHLGQNASAQGFRSEPWLFYHATMGYILFEVCVCVLSLYPVMAQHLTNKYKSEQIVAKTKSDYLALADSCNEFLGSLGLCRHQDGTKHKAVSITFTKLASVLSTGPDT